jgi:hypothetical protein
MKMGGAKPPGWQGAASSKAPRRAQCRPRAHAASHRGTNFKSLFTNWAGPRYDGEMLWLAAAAIAASTPRPAAPITVQARAMVRIVSGVRIRFGEGMTSDHPAARDRLVRTEVGIQTAKLVEFE